jgi:hypothetical protein
MQTQTAYAALARELERARQLPQADLISLAASSPCTRSLDVNGELLEIELFAAWCDDNRSSVRPTAIARGASTWHTERLEESITVALAPCISDGA